jgi:hypothetical protein
LYSRQACHDIGNPPFGLRRSGYPRLVPQESMYEPFKDLTDKEMKDFENLTECSGLRILSKLNIISWMGECD